MTKLLEVAEAFKKQSQTEAQSINESVKAAIKQHEQDLIALLADANKSLENVIQTEQVKLAKRFRKMFSLVSLSVLLLLALVTAVIAFLANQEYNKMMDWKQSAENYQELSQTIKVKTCRISETEARYCVEIDPKFKNKYWGEDGNIAVLTTKVEN